MEFEVRITTKYKDKVYVYVVKNKQKFCSEYCYHLYNKEKSLTGNRLIKQRQNVLIAIDSRKNNPEIRKKWIERMKEVTLGSKNHKWIEDRSKLTNQDGRNSYQYLAWSKSVLARDGYRCKINDGNCDGRLEVHHILSWKDYTELHYKINNGITLCHAHHPRKRAEEKRLIPVFQGLMSVSN